jgi:hypothetical protein
MFSEVILLHNIFLFSIHTSKLHFFCYEAVIALTVKLRQGVGINNLYHMVIGQSLVLGLILRLREGR